MPVDAKDHPTSNIRPLDRLLSIAEVGEITSYSRASIYRQVAKGCFPAPLKLRDAGRIAWRSSDLNAWLQTLPKANIKAA